MFNLYNVPLDLEKKRTDIILSVLQIIELKEQKQWFAQGQQANRDGSQGKMPNIQFPVWELFSQYHIPASGAASEITRSHVPGAVRGNLRSLMRRPWAGTGRAWL